MTKGTGSIGRGEKGLVSAEVLALSQNAQHVGSKDMAGLAGLNVHFIRQGYWACTDLAKALPTSPGS